MSEQKRYAAAVAPRLLQIDGLRAIAALMVVAFHYTYGFEQRFHHAHPLEFTLSFGYLGVNLFFAISGFVIFMTLDRCQRPMDFVASRFARLFPTYWAAVAITFGTMQVLAVPGYDVSWLQALANLLMVHAFFGVPDVDGVYWSLQVELLFYIWMLAIWGLGLLRHCLALSFVWVGGGLLCALAQYQFGIKIPATIPRFLLLESIPWFVIGMTAFITLRDRQWRPAHLMLLALCVVTIALRGEIDRVIAAVASIALLLLASRGFLPWLTLRPLVFFGAISYPLYLVHEKIGWAVLLTIEPHLPSSWLAIAVALGVSIAIATTLHYLVEDPSRRAIRDVHSRMRSAVAPVQPGNALAGQGVSIWFPRWSLGACVAMLVLSGGNFVAKRLSSAHVVASLGTFLALPIGSAGTGHSLRLPLSAERERAISRKSRFCSKG